MKRSRRNWIWNRIVALIFLLCYLVARFACAQDFKAAAKDILPSGVHLGMYVAELTQMRPAIFEGPSAFLPEEHDAKTHRTFMEGQNMGSPDQLYYWYLCSEDKLIGLLRRRIFVEANSISSKMEAQNTYRQLVQQLGESNQEIHVRVDGKVFIPIRADVWRSKEGRAVSFIATNQEMTVSIVEEAANFPLGQIFIRPDPQRFPMGIPEKCSIRDFERPTGAAGQKLILDSLPAKLPTYTPKQHPPDPIADQSAAANSPDAPPKMAQPSKSNTVTFFIFSAFIAAVAIILFSYRRT